MEKRAIQPCEDILQREIEYNKEHEILSSETAVAECLLVRTIELQDAYLELNEKLGSKPPALKVFLGLLLSVAAFWNPDQLKEARSQRKRLEEINGDISGKASELASLLDQRTAIENASSFGSDTHYHCMNVIVEAAAENHLFNSWVREDLKNLSARFDLKYWPSLGDFVTEISRDASVAEVISHDPITLASTSSRRNSLADFLRALRAAIYENSASNFGQLPDDFKVSDGTLASLTNCALDLPQNAIIDGQYVKRLRQRDRG
ncbi:MAG: hypothetical protein WBC93_09355 [Sulfitobacter sp.]